MAAVLCIPAPEMPEKMVDARAQEALSPTFGQTSLHELTFAYLCLQPMQPRTWWRLRGLSAEWRRLLDGHSEEGGSGLIPMLVNTMGPLSTANREVDFAGCVYAAVHHGSTSTLRQFLRPLASPSWARRSFVRGVAREALIQASISGEVACCAALLEAHGPASPLIAAELSSGSSASGCLAVADIEMAQREAEEWEAASPGSCSPDLRCAVIKVLNSAIESGSKAKA